MSHGVFFLLFILSLCFGDGSYRYTHVLNEFAPGCMPWTDPQHTIDPRINSSSRVAYILADP